MNEQTNGLLAEAEENLRMLTAAARSYRDDPEFRAQLETDPQTALAGVGVDLDVPGSDIQVRANTAEVFHLVMPADPNSTLTDEMVQNIAGGSTASTAGSAGSGSTISTPASSVSSAGTAGSAGSATSN